MSKEFIEGRGTLGSHQPFKADFFIRHPLFFSDVQARTREVGITAAIAEKFDRLNIQIKLENNSGIWTKPGTPTLFIGDHRAGLESFLLYAICGQFGRDDIRIVAKPYAIAGQVVTAVAGVENSYILDVMPSTMAKDRTDGSTPTKFFRHIFSKDLLSRNEIKNLNRRSLVEAAGILEQGGAVAMYPTGEHTSSINEPWRAGVGQIINFIQGEAQKHTVVVPFLPDILTLRHISPAMLLEHVGVRPKRREIVVRLGKQETLGEIFSDVSSLNADAITTELQRRFQQDFRK